MIPAAPAADWLTAEAAPDLIEEHGGHRTSASKPASRDGLTGIAAATGPARLMPHPDDFARLQQGDILVAPSTDPGWTPLFLLASGLVCETGGYLSHGATVAREFGLPAVVNVAGVFGTLRDGETVTVDGDAGYIRRQTTG